MAEVAFSWATPGAKTDVDPKLVWEIALHWSHLHHEEVSSQLLPIITLNFPDLTVIIYDRSPGHW